jgi:isochorismate pyruvate lyase
MDIKKCETLDEARVEIDKVDEQIVGLVALRNAYIKQIAHFKTSIDEVKSKERVADVIGHARAKAIELNLSPNLINDMFIRMIDEMVESEIAEFKNAKVY